MYYDINSIRKITEQGIPDLADKIFAGVVDEEQAMNALFKGLRPKLAKELEKRRADEVLWIDASNSKEIKKLKDYVETYDNEAPEYIGRHIDEAKKLIELIENDDKEWYAVKLKNTVDSYKHYLDIYDNPAPSYRGKYVDQVKKAIKIVKDKEDWAKAQDENTIESYVRYLSIYDKHTPDYVGIYVNDAKQAIKALEDEADWLYAVNINTIDSYRDYLAKYDTNPPAYKGKYIDEAQQKIEMLLPPPSSEPPIVFPDPPITSPDPRIADDEAWAMAIKFNTIEAYNDYLREYDSQDSASYKGVHVEEAKLAIKRQAEKDWNIAVTEHTLDSYERYLSKYNSISKYVGRYVAQAQYALLRLREEEDDWKIACAEDTLTSYKNFVAKYKAMKTSIHLSQAEEKIKELTPPTPNKWIKWLTQALLFIIFCAFFYQLKHHHVWPFNEQQQKVIVEPVDSLIAESIDSLQWAIDNHNIPVLKEYADRDSTRAFYPLSLELWNQSKDTLNSLIYIRKAISSIQTSSPLYQDYNNQLEVIKNALDYYNTIGHIAPALSANIEERLLVLPTEYAIIKRASEIAEKYSFEYTPNKGILKYINDDFRRWVEAGDNSPIRATKEDCYKAALQLKEDELVRRKLNGLANKLKI